MLYFVWNKGTKADNTSNLAMNANARWDVYFRPTRIQNWLNPHFKVFFSYNMIFFPSQIIQLTYLHQINTFGFYSQPVLRLAVWFYMYFRPKDKLTRAYINTCTETLVLHYDVKFMYVICRFVSVYHFTMTKMNLLKISQKI